MQNVQQTFRKLFSSFAVLGSYYNLQTDMIE